MKLKGSHFFYLFVIVLVGSVYYFDYYQGMQREQKKDKDAILLPFATDEVERIEVKNLAGELEVVKTPEGWKLKKPVEDLAAEEETKAWIQSLTTEKSLEKIGEGESFEWTTYGLDKPQSTIIVHSSTGKKIELQISGKKNFEGNPFIKRNDEKWVYVGSSVWSALGEKSVKEIRDARVLREHLQDLEAVVLTRGSNELRFNRKDGRWNSLSQPTWSLDQNKVREIINVGQEMRTTEFVLESDPTQEQSKGYGFSPPEGKLTYLLKNNKALILEFGRGIDKTWYVWPRDLKRVVKVDETVLQKLLKTNLSEMRDREAPFIFNKDEVKKVNILAEKKVEFSKEGESWKASVPGAVEEAEVNQLLEHLRQLRVAEFMDGKATAPGIENSSKQFILADAQGKSLWDLKIGSSFKKKENKEEKTYFYAKSSKYPDVVIIKEEDMASLTTDKLIKSETTTKDSPSHSSAPQEPEVQTGEIPKEIQTQ